MEHLAVPVKGRASSCHACGTRRTGVDKDEVLKLEADWPLPSWRILRLWHQHWVLIPSVGKK